MAWEQTLVANEAHAPRAAADLRTFQFYPVHLSAAGTVTLHSNVAGSLAGSPVFVLGNKPNSGEACELVSPPNTTKAFCAGSTTIGGFVVIAGSGIGFTCARSSGALPGYVGNAWEAVNSGQLFALKLRA